MAIRTAAKQVVFTAAEVAAAIVPLPQANVVYNVIREIAHQCEGLKSHKVCLRFLSGSMRGSRKLGVQEKVQELTNQVQDLENIFRKHQEAMSRTQLPMSVEGVLSYV